MQAQALAELAERPVCLAPQQWGALGSRLTALESGMQVELRKDTNPDVACQISYFQHSTAYSAVGSPGLALKCPGARDANQHGV